MGFNESPSLDQYQDGLQSKVKSRPSRRKVTWAIIIALAVLSLVIWFFVFTSSGSMNVVLGRGALTGRVLSAEGQALSNGYAFVQGSDQEVALDAEGFFTLEGVPAGSQNLVIAHHGAAEEYPVEIQSGATTDAGELIFIIVTQVPEED